MDGHEDELVHVDLSNMLFGHRRQRVRDIRMAGPYLIQVGEEEMILEVSIQRGGSLWGELCVTEEDENGQFDVATDDRYVFRPVTRLPGTVLASLKAA